MSSRQKRDNRWSDIDGGAAFIIPLTLLRHPNYIRLSHHSNKLLMDLARQYTGFNNGYLCASWSLMKQCGWHSTGTLQTAVLECEHYGLLIRTQQGGRNKPNLHAFSWRRIDEKPGQPLDRLPTSKPTDDWKGERPVFIAPKRTPKARKRPPKSAPKAAIGGGLGDGRRRVRRTA